MHKHKQFPSFSSLLQFLFLSGSFCTTTHPGVFESHGSATHINKWLIPMHPLTLAGRFLHGSHWSYNATLWSPHQHIMFMNWIYWKIYNSSLFFRLCFKLGFLPVYQIIIKQVSWCQISHLRELEIWLAKQFISGLIWLRKMTFVKNTSRLKMDPRCMQECFGAWWCIKAPECG